MKTEKRKETWSSSFVAALAAAVGAAAERWAVVAVDDSTKTALFVSENAEVHELGCLFRCDTSLCSLIGMLPMVLGRGAAVVVLTTRLSWDENCVRSGKRSASFHEKVSPRPRRNF